MTLGGLLLRMHEACCCGKNIYRRGRPTILTDSARKRIGKEVLANHNKKIIIIGHQHDRWMELKEALGVHTHAEVQLRM